LKKLSIKPGAACRYGLAALAGLLISLSFAPWNIAGAAWVGPGLMLFCGVGQRPGTAFRLGFVAGFVHFLTSLYWLLSIPYAWHGIPLAPGLGWIALSAYSGLFFGLWVWFCWKIFSGVSRNPLLPFVATLDEFLSVNWFKRAEWAVFCAMGWTALELIRGRFLGGFPWNFLGASQYAMLPLIQIASITGILGVSFMIVWFSVGVGNALLVLAQRPSTTGIWGQAALPLLTLSCIAAYGMVKTMRIVPPERQISMALIQPSIPQTLIWDPNENAARFHDVLALSGKALEDKPDVLVWPESAVPDMSTETQQAIGRLLATNSAWLIFSGDAAALTSSGETNYYNSSFLISPESEVRGIYHKRRLVIFGEYIPLLRYLPFLKWLSPVGSGYTPGVRAEQFSMTNLQAKTSVLICFEDMFPNEAREHVEPDTDFLINLTNDGWFGEQAEQWQQAGSAVFRAIENGVPLVRCCNNGLTCWIDPQGRIKNILREDGSIYRRGFVVPKIPLRDPSERQRTIYNIYGDWFAWSCCGMSGMLLSLAWRRRNVAI
jgi:apolipoprotein N-acyltransferase